MGDHSAEIRPSVIQDKKPTFAERAWEGYVNASEKSAAWLKDIAARIRPWVPVLPDYLQYKVKKHEAFITLTHGIDPETSKPLTLRERLKKAGRFEMAALLHAGKSILELVLLTSPSPEATTAQKMASVARSPQPEAAFLGNTIAFLKKTIGKIPEGAARQGATTVIGGLDKVFGTKAGRIGMVSFLKSQEPWQQSLAHIRAAEQKTSPLEAQKRKPRPSAQPA